MQCHNNPYMVYTMFSKDHSLYRFILSSFCQMISRIENIQLTDDNSDIGSPLKTSNKQLAFYRCGAMD